MNRKLREEMKLKFAKVPQPAFSAPPLTGMTHKLNVCHFVAACNTNKVQNDTPWDRIFLVILREALRIIAGDHNVSALVKISLLF